MSATLDAVRELAPRISERSEQIERERRIPQVLLGQLTEAGCFRMMTPRGYGGDELPLPEIIEIVTELARADAAVGWCIGQHCSAQLILADFPGSAIAEVFAGGPDVVVAGATAPKGRALWTGDGWRVSGRWPFVSGCQWASWLYVTCRTVEDPTDPDRPPVVMALVPAAQARIEDTWTVAGLAGTGSHDIVVQASCPPVRCRELDPRDGLPAAEPGALLVAAVTLGIAQRALDEIVTVAVAGKRPAFSPDALAAAPLFQHGLGGADMTVRAAAALLRTQTADVWRAITAGQPLDEVGRARAYATAATVTAMARQATSEAYAMGGGSAVYTVNPLQRALRDIHAGAQHMLNGPHMVTRLGTALVAAAAHVEAVAQLSAAPA